MGNIILDFIKSVRSPHEKALTYSDIDFLDAKASAALEFIAEKKLSLGYFNSERKDYKHIAASYESIKNAKDSMQKLIGGAYMQELAQKNYDKGDKESKKEMNNWLEHVDVQGLSTVRTGLEIAMKNFRNGLSSKNKMLFDSSVKSATRYVASGQVINNPVERE